jgi:hypothetical protein
MKAYKYLGVEESHNIEHKKVKDRLKKEYIRRAVTRRGEQDD